MEREEFYHMQYAYCRDKSRNDGFIYCGDCVNSCNCKWEEEYGLECMEYCENFTHIADTYYFIGGVVNE